MSLESKLFKKVSINILPAVALASAIGYGNVQAQDSFFTDDFETQPVTNIIGLEEGFESTRTVTANICDNDGKGIDSVIIRYQSVDAPASQRALGKYKASGNSKSGNEGIRGTGGWVEVPLAPQAGGASGIGQCEGYETTSMLPLEYGLALDDNGLIDWEFQINYSNGDVGFYPEGTVNRTKYWANEGTAQATIEDVLNNDSRVSVDCYECPVTLPSGTDVEYDAIGFFVNGEGNFALQYRSELPENVVSEMRDYYESFGANDTFYIIENSSIEEIRNSIDSNLFQD